MVGVCLDQGGLDRGRVRDHEEEEGTSSRRGLRCSLLLSPCAMVRVVLFVLLRARLVGTDELLLLLRLRRCCCCRCCCCRGRGGAMSFWEEGETVRIVLRREGEKIRVRVVFSGGRLTRLRLG